MYIAARVRSSLEVRVFVVNLYETAAVFRYYQQECKLVALLT
jgi:hypothetical protein